ncbi:hypothetical protein RZS28_09400 [Methylocapsa polymorpha]|uniref:Uncharacterized protein n=1 Tax=Methylocapsa polymorpha TaxID=3080828 RepID=A0ABZ0HNI5_9HYPH|nr:hypothetical protein RZS28_09400 [Methylocapsa sp. RX1]
MLWIAGLFLIFIGLLWFWVGPKIVEFRTSIGLDAKIAEAESLWARLKLQTQGVKTILVLVGGAIATILPEVTKDLADVDLSPLIGSNWAGKVAAATSLVATITHISGLLSAARAKPVQTNE